MLRRESREAAQTGWSARRPGISGASMRKCRAGARRCPRCQVCRVAYRRGTSTQPLWPRQAFEAVAASSAELGPTVPPQRTRSEDGEPALSRPLLRSTVGRFDSHQRLRRGMGTKACKGGENPRHRTMAPAGVAKRKARKDRSFSSATTSDWALRSRSNLSARSWVSLVLRSSCVRRAPQATLSRSRRRSKRTLSPGHRTRPRSGPWRTTHRRAHLKTKTRSE